MQHGLINRTMDRDDLLSEHGSRFVAELDALSVTLDERQLPVTSWYGALPRYGFDLSWSGFKAAVKKRLAGGRVVGAEALINRGGDAYESLPNVTCDDRHPWFLYWEAYWVMTHGPAIDASCRLLDAGGTASLFSCYLASRGAEVHSVDLNADLVAAGQQIGRAMGWRLSSVCMDMTALEFPDDHFDHAYSICVFEHLDHVSRGRALDEIARVLKPGGLLSITFDYGAPGVHLAGRGHDYESANLIRSPDDVERHFLSSGAFEPVGNPRFEDNGKTYLAWPPTPAQRYTFGAVFLRKPA